MQRSVWLVVVGALFTVNCGEGGDRRITDAPVHGVDDAPTDAPPAPAPVTVTVTDNSGPRVDLPAYFQNRDSSVVSSTLTDGSGTASAVMAAGGYVTVVLPYLPPAFGGTTLQYQLYTWAGVKPGDHLVIDNRYPHGLPSNVTFTLPIDSQHIFSNYYIASTCGYGSSNGAAGSAQSTIVVTASFSNCANDTADLVVYATDSSGTLVSSFSVIAQAIVDQSAVDYTAKAYGAPLPRDLELDNNDPPSSAITATDHLATPRGEVYSNGVTLALAATATGQQLLPALPTGASETLQFRQSVGLTERTFYEFGTTGAYVRDWATVRIPDFDTAVTPDLDTGTHAVTWANAAATGITPDFSLAAVRSGRALTVTSYLSYTWFIAGPATTPTLIFPELPADVQDFNVKATDNHSFVGLAQASAPGGYDTFRAKVFQAADPALPAGKVSATRYAFNFGLLGRLRSHLHVALTPNDQRPFLLRREN